MMRQRTGKVSRPRLPALLAVVIGLAAAGPLPALATSAGTSSNFTLVGHDPLFNRGMNAAPAIYDHYIYVGSRTDGQPGHLHPGVLVLDIADPTKPTFVNEIAATAVDPRLALGYTSRELRVWPQQKLLIVLYFSCNPELHQCYGGDPGIGFGPFQQIAFFDLRDPANPKYVNSYVPSAQPHEMFFWVDPKNPADRALMYFTSPNSGSSLVVTDISRWRTGKFTELVLTDFAHLFTGSQQRACPGGSCDVRLHSISVSPDGTRVYLAHLGGGVLIADSSSVANNLPNPKIPLVTPVAGRAFWDIEGAHSAVKVPGRPYVVATEEIVGKAVYVQLVFTGRFGCPWGWARVIDVTDETHLKIISEYKIDENQESFCNGVSPQADNYSSYASHNPTALPDVALVTWYSGGLQAINLADPSHPTRAGFYLPNPEPFSVTPDPNVEPGSNNVIAWSYPIIKNGLVYYIDIRNGLYVVKYSGPHAEEVANVGFLEGNSNLGDAVRLDKSSVANITALAPSLPGTSGVVAAAKEWIGLVASLLFLVGACVFLARSARRRAI